MDNSPDAPPQDDDLRIGSTTDPAYEEYQLFTQLGWLADYDLPPPSTTTSPRADFQPHALLQREHRRRGQERGRCRATDPGAAVALWSQVDRMLVDDGAFVTLGNRVNMQLVSTRVGNYQARASYGAVLSQLWVRCPHAGLSLRRRAPGRGPAGQLETTSTVFVIANSSPPTNFTSMLQTWWPTGR